MMLMASVMVAAVIFVACEETNPEDKPDPDKPDVPVTSVTINPPPAGVDLTAGGGTLTLTVRIEPANATDQALTWTSSDPSIATVNNQGVVTGLKEGTVTITATTSDGKIAAQYTLTVKPDPSAGPIELTNAIINAGNVTLVAGVYQVKSDLTLNSGNNLTISPGVTIRFNENRKLSAPNNTKIIANGTSSQPIIFTSSNENPVAGDWYGIYISQSGSEFSWCIFEFGSGQSSGWGMLYLDDCKASVKNCTFRNAKYSGIYLYRAGSGFTTFDNNTIINCGETDAESYPVKVGTSANLSCLGDMGDNDITTNKGIGVSRGTIPRNTTIKSYVHYQFYGDQTLNNAAELTIEAGSTLEFDKDGVMYVNEGAKIIAEGTSVNPITFTSSKTTNKGAGDWWGVYINSSNNSDFKYCIFEYGSGESSGWGMFYLENSKASVTNCTFRHSRYNGIYLYRGNSGFTTFDNNTISDCGETDAESYPIKAGTNAGIMTLSGMGDNNTINSDKGIGIWGSTVSADFTLRKYLYTFYGSLTISQTGSGATLTVLPGAKLMFMQGLRVYVGAGGKLIAQGTSSDKIIFTGTVQDRGWWNGIIFDNNNALSGSVIRYCEVSYGGRGTSSGDNGNISCWGIRSGVLTVGNCTITHSRAWGIYVQTTGSSSQIANPTIENNNTFSNNGPSNDSNTGNTVIGRY